MVFPVYYDFSDVIDNLYSSLVVSLALNERCGRALVEKSCALRAAVDGRVRCA